MASSIQFSPFNPYQGRRPNSSPADPNVINPIGFRPFNLYQGKRTSSSNTVPHIDVYVFSEKDGEICQNKGCMNVLSFPQARTIYNTINSVHEFFFENFHLNGLDGKGKSAPIQIKWNEINASWSCATQIKSKELSCHFQFHNQYVVQPEVVAHEWTHAIIHHLAPLNRTGQAGALNESMADIFGIVFKSWATKTEPDWKIAGRNLSQHPRRFLSVGRYNPENDYGWVHQNSCIPSHAFYMTVASLPKEKMVTIAKVWFLAMGQMKPEETFVDFANKTISAVQHLSLSKERSKKLSDILRKAWNHVDVSPSAVQHLSLSKKKK